MLHNAGVSGQYPPPPPQQPGPPGWGAAPPPSHQPTQGYTPQSYSGYGGGSGPTGPYQGYPPHGGGQGGGGKGLLITTIVVGAVAVIAAITTMIIVLTNGDSDSTAGDDETSQTEDPTTDPTTSDAPTEESPTTDPPPDGAVPVGTESRVGDWSVTVTAFEPNADQLIKEANQFNEPPKVGRFVLATLNARYNGTGEGNISFDLHMTFIGPGGQEYEDYDCGAVEPRSSINAPALKRGEEFTFETCFDVPIAAIDGATMSVNEDFDDATEVTFDL